MKETICDVKDCSNVAYREILIKGNYWIGEKELKIDICTEHKIAILKILGFDGKTNWDTEREVACYKRNQWRERK